MAAVEQQDDQIAEAVYRLRRVAIDRQHIPALTDKTFETHINENDLSVVLFYLTCMYMGPLLTIVRQCASLSLSSTHARASA